MGETIVGSWLQYGILGTVTATLIFLLMKVYTDKETASKEYRQKEREEISVMKDLTNIVNVMNSTLSLTPSDIRDKISADISAQLTTIEHKLDILISKYGKG